MKKKRIDVDSKYFKISLYTFVTVGLLIILWKIVNSSDNLFETLMSALGFLWNSISVVVAGLIMGYILSPIADAIYKLQKKIFKKATSEKARKRMFNSSIIIVYILLLALITIAFVFIIPNLLDNIVELANNLTKYSEIITNWYEETIKDSQYLNNEYLTTITDNAESAFSDNINNIVLAFAEGLATGLMGVVTGIFNFTLIIAISIYSLIYSKDLKHNIIEFCELKFGKRKTYSVISFLRNVDWVFGKYISAKLVQIFVMFTITQIVFIIIGLDLSTLLAFFVAICNVIPFIGPVIGAVPAIIFGLFDSLATAIWVLVAIIAIQQVDAYVIDPFLVGDKMGLNPFWVITVVVISGNLFGLVGVILCVPVAAIIRLVIVRYVNGQKKKKENEAELKATGKQEPVSE